ncbi:MULTISPECIES: BON domain-containing protein [Streptomyces]|nr:MULTISPECIES: BON domain-containing protein [Streptomyces]
MSHTALAIGRDAPYKEIDVTVVDGVATIRGSLPDRSMVPLVARAARAVEGVVDVRMDLGSP